MTTALLYLLGSTVILVIMTVVFRVEDARDGKYVLFSRSRKGLNWLCVEVLYQIARIQAHVVYPVFHYAAHRLLQRLYRFTQKVNDRIESLIRQNKKIAKKTTVKRKRNHLDEIAQHKEDVALTDDQKKKMRSH